MTDNAAQVFSRIPSESLVNKNPRGLSWNSPLVPCKPHHVEVIQGIQYLPSPIEVAQVNIVVNEYQNSWVFRRFGDYLVVERWKATRVVREKPDFGGWIVIDG